MSIYLAAMGFGLVLLASTIFLGDSDLDADTDIDMDPNIDFDAEVDFTVDGAGELDALNTAEKKSKSRFIPFLSIRFWTFGLTIFGVTGFILVKMDQGPAVHASLAVAMGVLVGWAAALIFHQLKNTTVDSSTNTDQLAGHQGEVTLTIRTTGAGKVRVRSKEQYLELVATTSHTEDLQIGDKVLILKSQDGQLVVAPFPSLNQD